MNNSQKSPTNKINNNKHINANIIHKTDAQNKRQHSMPNDVFMDSAENDNFQVM
jgi:hypothetical protein